MRKILLALFFIGTALPARAAYIVGPTISTATGRATYGFTGSYYLNGSSVTSSTVSPSIILNGATGGVNVTSITAITSVTASAFFGDGSHMTGLAALSGGTTPQIPYWTGAASLGNSNLSQNANGSLTSSSSFTVTGTQGILTGSSVTASAFFGNGSKLTGIPSTASISGVYAALSGATFTGASGITNAAFTATGPSGNVVSGASVTASAFFGDGSNLSGLSGTLSGGTAPKFPYWTSGNTLGNSNLSQSSSGDLTATSSFTALGANGILTKSSVTASAFFGDISHTSGYPSWFKAAAVFHGTTSQSILNNDINVASTTRVATGRYYVNLKSPAASNGSSMATYAIFCWCGDSNSKQFCSNGFFDMSSVQASSYLGQVRISCSNSGGNFVDSDFITVLVIDVPFD